MPLISPLMPVPLVVHVCLAQILRLSEDYHTLNMSLMNKLLDIC